MERLIENTMMKTVDQSFAVSHDSSVELLIRNKLSKTVMRLLPYPM
jgi:hypothetical protein